MGEKIRIESIIASKTGITLYLANGETMNLSSNNWKTKVILDQALAPVARGEAVTIDIDSFSIEKAIEEKTGGLVRFFKRIVKAVVGTSDEKQPAHETGDTFKLAIEHTPVVAAAPEKELPLGSSEGELVAAVKTPQGEKIIRNVDKLSNHMEHAARSGNTRGLQAFMTRIASMPHEHTVDELLNFMERGDLPIADDGCIVAYKMLYKRDGHYVDPHTKLVTQKVGSLVSQSRKLIDPSRRTECSTGLHIARRSYLGSFHGDVIVLVKIAPENVVAVPFNEPSKMRVAAYHIVGELPKEAFSLLKANRPMTTDSPAARMLADVIAGNHIGVTEYVEIGAAGGGSVTIRTAKVQTEAPVGGINGEAKAIDDMRAEKSVSPVELRERAKAAKAETPTDQTTHVEGSVSSQAAPAPAMKPKGNRFVAKYPMIAGESKADRDARIKREKYAAAKLAKEKKAEIDNIAADLEGPVKAAPSPKAKPVKKPKAAPAPLDPMRKIDGETKSQRDARIKREKYALAKSVKG